MIAEFNKFNKVAFSVDNVIFGFDETNLKVLLIKRGVEPYIGYWGLPGYLVNTDEDLDDAAALILERLTGLQNVYLEQVHAFGKVNRHPEGRVITVAYYSLVKISDFTPSPASFALEVAWHSLDDLPNLAFDHAEVLQACVLALRTRVKVRPVGFELLPPKFTLTQLQQLYEAILEDELDKRNFRKKILSMDFIVDLNESQEGVAHRPARLYEFNKEKYRQFVERGFIFDFAFSNTSKNGKRNFEHHELTYFAKTY